MPTPDQAVELRARVARARAMRELHEAVHAFAWRALERYRLSDADRQDVAQNVVIAAFQRRDAYRADRGAPGAWLWGLVRNEVRAFARGRCLELVAAEGFDPPSEAPTPEESVSMEQLADHLLDLVPIDARRVVMLHEMFGLTFRDIARLEGISPTQAHARHRAGMEALEIAVLRWKRKQEHRGVAVLPMTAAAILAPHRGVAGPPPGVVESAWRRLVSELGIDEPSESEPPESGPRRCEAAEPAVQPPRLGAPLLPARWLRLLGPIVGASLGGLVGGVALGHCGPPPREAAAAASAPVESASSVAASAVAPSPPSATPSPAMATVSAGPATVVRLAAPPRRAPASRDDAPRVAGDEARGDAERALVDRARAALAAENLAGGLAALEEHARLFPHGQHADARERLWTEGCAHARLSTGRPSQEARCAGRP
jgi:RNA polymerase sigma factor (sigma-70 family)